MLENGAIPLAAEECFSENIGRLAAAAPQIGAIKRRTTAQGAVADIRHSGGGIRTRDLRVMSPTSYQTAPPRVAPSVLAKIARRNRSGADGARTGPARRGRPSPHAPPRGPPPPPRPPRAPPPRAPPRLYHPARARRGRRHRNELDAPLDRRRRPRDGR